MSPKTIRTSIVVCYMQLKQRKRGAENLFFVVEVVGITLEEKTSNSPRLYPIVEGTTWEDVCLLSLLFRISYVPTTRINLHFPRK